MTSLKVVGILFSSCLFLLAQGGSVTYDGLGTFNDQAPWGGTDERPGNYIPASPESINTRLYLDTRRKRSVEVYNTDMTNLQATTFDPNKMTRIIIHGYVQNGDTTWLSDMSEAHLAQADVNSVRVGWVGGSLQLNYFQVCADLRVVGAEIGLLMKNIINNLGGDVKKFHCIGHSLGAHACAYASNYLESRGLGKISRITGLDPAGPYFQNTDNEVRLESSDADFVDALHTDAEKLINLGMGIDQESGHVDYWPNDGFQQPGCDQNGLTTIWDPDGIWEGATNFVACNHMRSYKFYTESILSACPFTAYPCSSYADFLAGKCSQCDGNCGTLGFRADEKSVETSSAWSTNFYLSTNYESPYCEYMTDVQVHTAANSDDVEGRLFLTLYGPNGNTEQVQLSDDGVTLELKASRIYSHLVYYMSFPDGIDHVKLLWYQDEWAITNRHINVDTITLFVGHTQQTLNFCGDSTVDMKSERRYQFNLC